MSETVIIELNGNQNQFRPGEPVSGRARWTLEKAPKSISVRLFWYTQGKGTQDVGVVDSVEVDRPGSEGQTEFKFVLPESPYSFSGRLISLLWAVEAVVQPSDRTGRAEITVSPSKQEIELGSVDE